MNNPLGVSPSKGYQGTTRGKEKILMTSVGIEPTTSGLDLPLLCRLSYEVGQRKSGTIKVIKPSYFYFSLVSSFKFIDTIPQFVFVRFDGLKSGKYFSFRIKKKKKKREEFRNFYQFFNCILYFADFWWKSRLSASVDSSSNSPMPAFLSLDSHDDFRSGYRNFSECHS